ncbi:MAG: hemerythrin domain-containing protein [Pseudomonadota bacterium]
MDIFEAIEQDHQEIRRLIHRLRGLEEDDRSNQDKVFEELKALLLRHHEAEERTFFYALLDDKTARHEGMHALQEHGEHKKVLEQLDEMRPGSDNWWERFAELEHDILHHLEEEEEDIFPLARKVFSKQEAEELGTSIGQVKGGLNAAS